MTKPEDRDEKRRMPMPEGKTVPYYRVFPELQMKDPDYLFLDYKQWGLAKLLEMWQWTLGGTLPKDRKQLCTLLRVRRDVLDTFLTLWPKLVEVDGRPDRVAIPYLLKEWKHFNEISESNSASAKAAAEARRAAKEASATAGRTPERTHPSALDPPWLGPPDRGPPHHRCNPTASRSALANP